MRYQPTSNFHFSDAGGVSLPPEIAEEMRRRGISQTPFAAPGMVDFGVKPARTEVRERWFKPSELLGLFDGRELLCMTYIPHFITQCIMYYVDALCDHTTRNRLGEYKKLKRTLSEVRREYHSALRTEMPPNIYEKFLAQRDRYLASCGSYLQILYFTFINELTHKHKHVENETVVCYSFMIASMAQYVEDYDRDTNKKIAERLGLPVHNYGDARVRYVKEVCREVVGRYDMPQTEQTRMAMRVMANKAMALINEMIEEPTS